MHIEQEQRRQVWLAAFGLTPWVAKTRLPGARASRLLHLPVETSGALIDVVPQAAVAASAVATQTVAAVAAPVATPASTPAPTAVTPASQASTSSASTTAAPRLCIYQSAQTLLIVEQQDRQAPELSRDEQQLLLALLQVFGKEHKRYPFLCPKQPQHAHDTLAAFVGGLATQGCTRVLLCLDDDACQHLLGEQARYQAFQLGDLPALAISSLGEMLSAPLMHKKKSWASMCEAGLDH